MLCVVCVCCVLCVCVLCVLCVVCVVCCVCVLCVVCVCVCCVVLCVVCVCVCLVDLTCTFAYWQSTSVAAVLTPKEREVVTAEQFEPSSYAEDTSELTEKLRKTEVGIHQ